MVSVVETALGVGRDIIKWCHWPRDVAGSVA